MSSSPPSASASGAPDLAVRKAAAKLRRTRKLRRRTAGALALLIGLVGAGLLASALTPEPQVATAQNDDVALIREGQALYEMSCITCHGENLQGVVDRGPSLVGVGEAAVYFQVSSGRMPASRQEAQAGEKPVKFEPEEIDALGAYVQANGGGPTVPEGELVGHDTARGGDLFRLNCASCHQFTGRGIALSSGKFAPEIADVNPEQIHSAMLTGPQNMPKFSDRQLTPEDKADITAYIQSITEEPNNPGGWSLGGGGAVSAGFIPRVVGGGAVG